MDIFEDFDASYGHGTYTSMSDGMGGENILYGGVVVGHEAPLDNIDMDGTLRTTNSQGGTDVVKGGHIISHSMSNTIGGMDIYHDGNLHHETMSNTLGGIDVYENGNLVGISMDNGIGGEDYLSLSGNTDAISMYDDPLIHSTECQFEPFDIRGNRL